MEHGGKVHFGVFSWKYPAHIYQPLKLREPMFDTQTPSSFDLLLLKTPWTRTKIGTRALRAAAPAVWNSLPLEVRQSSSTESLKQKLLLHFGLSA